jgi:1-aminocyclopropane-1-carboxylate deaminase
MFDFPINSPLQELHDPLFDKRGVQVLIKRDDLIHPFLSGNKWRKLKYVLSSASQQGKSHLVTFGGAWSNHLVATAYAGNQFGFRTSAFVRGETRDNPVLQLCQKLGMQLHLADRSAYKQKLQLFEKHFLHDSEALYIGEGGFSSEAIQGCAELISELPQDTTHLFSAVGTGTTLAGLSLGIHKELPKCQLHGTPVLKNASYLKEEIKSLYANAQFHLHFDFHQGGYAKMTPHLIAFIHSFYQKHQVLLDPIYTSKMFLGVYTLINDGQFAKGDKIIACHTGGLTGWFGKWEEKGELPLPTELLLRIQR